MTRLRWAGDQLLYYDYTPDTAKREPGRDTRIVAEASIYDEQKTLRVQIKVRVTGPELVGMTLADAISRGEAVREQAITKHHAQLPRGCRTVLYDLQGNEIGDDGRVVP